MALLPEGAQVLTHCNTGALATGGVGTALAPVYVAHEAKRRVHVWISETRPLLQGARLTAWELRHAGIPCTLVTDSMAGALMRAARVDLVLVGADRVAANGDFANKIGTYQLAVLALHHGVPLYCAGALEHDRSGHADGRRDPDRASRGDRGDEHGGPGDRAGGDGRLEPGVRRDAGALRHGRTSPSAAWCGRRLRGEAMRTVLALDQGTTGSTALVIAADGRVLGRGYREIPQHFPAPGLVEHDPDGPVRAHGGRCARGDRGGRA